MEWEDIAKAAGRAVADAGVFVGHGIADGYRSIDPDVGRHLAQLPLLALSLLARKEASVEPKPDDGHPPLVFVHGLGGAPSTFWPMMAFLKLHGRKRSYAVDFGHASIRELALVLSAFIEEVCEKNRVDQVQIVAHSLGGIISRLALATPSTREKVHTLVTMGTPHAGTYPARYCNTDLTRLLRPDSPLIAELQQTPWPKDVRGVTFWSQNDLFVLPARSAAVPGTQQIEVTPFTHYSYLIDPKAWIAVARAL